jgi:predicted dehydrogenase
MLDTKSKKIIFFGLGGAGQRHLRIISNTFKNKYKLFAYRKKNKTPFLDKKCKPNFKKKISDTYNLEIIKNLNSCAKLNPDYVVISTPTSIRYEFIKIFKKKKITFLIEKPISHNLKEFYLIKKHLKKNNQKLYVLYQRRYYPHNILIKKILKKKSIGKILLSTFDVSSFMPDWHTYENYKKLYAAKNKLGGGVLLTECHELDLCHWFFGKPISFHGKVFKNKLFKLDVEDEAEFFLHYNNFLAKFKLNFLDKNPKRMITIYGTKGKILSNQINGNLRINFYKRKNLLWKKNIDRDYMFKQQIKNIFNNLNNNKTQRSIDIDRSIISIIEKIKKINNV